METRNSATGALTEAGWSIARTPSAPVFRPGPLPLRSVAAAGVGAGPDEARALAVFVIEKVGIDRGGKARIVQLQAQVFAALVRFLRPGGADLGAADKNPVGGGVLARGPQVGDEAHALGLQAEGEDFAGVFGAGLLEGADGRHVLSPFLLFRARVLAASMAIDSPEATAGAPPSRGPDSTGGTFLSREE